MKITRLKDLNNQSIVSLSLLGESIENSRRAMQENEWNGVKKGCRAMKVSLHNAIKVNLWLMTWCWLLIFNNQLEHHGAAQHAEIQIYSTGERWQEEIVQGKAGGLNGSTFLFPGW